MNKTDLLLQMMEQPHRYTADQWREILADDECRELYTLMSKTQSAIDATRADEEITDEIIDAEWQRFRSEKQEAKSKKHSFLKIAAMFAGVFFVSGITFAAIHIVRQYQEQETSQMEVMENVTTPATTVATDTLACDTVTVQPVIYDNIPLEKMLPEIATHYDAKVTFANDEARGLRFRFVWNPQQGIEQVVHDLNQFERLTVTLKDHQLIVE